MGRARGSNIARQLPAMTSFFRNPVPCAAGRRGVLFPWWARLSLFLAALVVSAPAQVPPTTNLHVLDRFLAKLEQTNQPITVVSFGDSMADSFRSATFHLMNKFADRMGVAGYSLVNYRNTALWVITNGAYQVTTGPFWFSHYIGMPAGSALWWNNQQNPGGVFCDVAGLYYVSQPAGGEFTISISTNGGPWTPYLAVNASNAIPTGHYTNVFLQPNIYRLRVDSLSGTNYILGRHQVLSQTGGVHVAFVDYPGINLGHVTNVPPTIREPIFAALDPDLIIWHMKEPLAGLSERMDAIEQSWTNCIPDAAVLYLGTPWSDFDTNSTLTIEQNTITRNIALAYDRAYYDLMTPTVSYPWMVAQGYMADGVHLSTAGGLFCANILWHNLGWFAARLPKQLVLAKSDGLAQISYHLTTNAFYRLETSTNFRDWSVVFTNDVAAGLFTTNLSAAPGAQFFRLGLSPR